MAYPVHIPPRFFRNIKKQKQSRESSSPQNKRKPPVGARALIIELQTSEMVTNRGPEVAFEFECMQNRTPPRETVGPRVGSGPGTRGRLITSSGYHD